MMRKAILFLLFSIVSFAQIPQGMSHRGTAYNTSGVILQNANISIRVRILDGNPGTQVFYTETHSVLTNNSGQYNLVIGNGSNPNPAFNTIDWSTAPKFLEIGIDPSNGTNYTVVGSSQLMSVPYALYSEKSSGLSMVTLNTVNELRTTNTHTKENLVYVKGYWYPGDNGGGFFSYIPTESQNDNDGIIIKPITAGSTGRWVRQYSGHIHSRFFGVINGDEYWNPLPQMVGISNSDRIQKMIDYASSNNVYSNKIGGMTLYFPNGSYFIDKKIILKNRTKLLGEPGTMFINHDGNYDYMFALDVGEVSILRIENFIINSNYHNDIGGFHLKGIFNSSNNPTGVSDAVFRNVRIINSKGVGINLEGGENTNNPSTDYKSPNQFLIFDNVRILKAKAENPALKITGQSANYTFINCEFGSEGVAGTCVLISPIGTFQPFGSNAMSFINCGLGMGSEYGAIIEHATGLTFDSCFFEGNDTAFLIKNSKQIKFTNNHFADCAGNGTRVLSHTNHTGTIFDISDSQVSIENNNIAISSGPYPNLNNQYFVQSQGGTNNTINLKDNSFDLPELSKTTGILQVIALNNYILNSAGKKLIFVNTPATYSASTNTLKRIDSSIGAGETMFIRANVGVLKINAMTTIVPNSNENIYLNGRVSITLNIGQAATFIKIDDAGGGYLPTYQLVSISN